MKWAENCVGKKEGMTQCFHDRRSIVNYFAPVTPLHIFNMIAIAGRLVPSFPINLWKFVVKIIAENGSQPARIYYIRTFT